MLRVNEIFGPTLQGEGPTAGRPCFFLRLAGCNLHCVWCDTYFTWNYEGTKFDPEHQYGGKVKMDEEVTKMTPKEVAAQLAEVAGTGPKRLIISGGEPMLQQEGLMDVVELLGERWEIEVETNGTVMPTAYMQERCQFNVSPKLQHSGNKEKLRRNVAVLTELNKGNAAFKFVVGMSVPSEAEEIRELCESANVPASRVWLMPLGHTRELVEKHGPEAADAAVKNGWNYSHRIHVQLWGSKRKV